MTYRVISFLLFLCTYVIFIADSIMMLELNDFCRSKRDLGPLWQLCILQTPLQSLKRMTVCVWSTSTVQTDSQTDRPGRMLLFIKLYDILRLLTSFSVSNFVQILCYCLADWIHLENLLVFNCTMGLGKYYQLAYYIFIGRENIVRGRKRSLNCSWLIPVGLYKSL